MDKMHTNTILDIVRVAPRNRKPQWTHKETQHLIREFDKRKHLLRPKLGEVVSSATKHRAWVEISQAVNLTNPHVHRTVSEVQKKWQNLCLRSRKDKELNIGSIYKTRGDRLRKEDVENLIIEQNIHQPLQPVPIQPKPAQPFQEHGTGSDVSNAIPIKLERVDGPDEYGRNNIPDNSNDSRPESVRSQMSYNDVEFITPAQHADIDMYTTSTGIVHTPYDRETIGSMPSVVPSSEPPRIPKRKLLLDESMNSPMNNSCPEYEILECKKNAVLAEIQKYKIECEKFRLEKEKLRVETEKIVLEKEKLAMELQNLRAANQQVQDKTQPKTTSELDRERQVLENEKLAAEIEHLKSMHKALMKKMLLEKHRYSLENEKLSLEIQKIRSTSGTTDSSFAATV